jgi:hypothetical protein
MDSTEQNGALFHHWNATSDKLIDRGTISTPCTPFAVRPARPLMGTATRRQAGDECGSLAAFKDFPQNVSTLLVNARKEKNHFLPNRCYLGRARSYR